PPGAPPAAVTAPPGLGTMLHAFRRCFWWALPLAILLGGAAFAVSLYVYPGSYSSSMTFRILTTSGHGTQEEEGHFSNVQRAHSPQIKSHAVLSEAIRKSDVAARYDVHYKPEDLAKKITTNFNEGPEEMTVTLSGDHPAAMAAVLEALGEIY